jgi:hypothetical protein
VLLYEQESSQSSLSLQSDNQSSLDTASPSPPLLPIELQQPQQQQQHACSQAVSTLQCTALPSAVSGAAKSSTATAANISADVVAEAKRPGSPEKRPGSPDKGSLTARSNKKRDICKDNNTTAAAAITKDAKGKSGQQHQQQQPAKFQFRQDAVRKPQLSAESWIPMDLRMKVSCTCSIHS